MLLLRHSPARGKGRLVFQESNKGMSYCGIWRSFSGCGRSSFEQRPWSTKPVAGPADGANLVRGLKRVPSGASSGSPWKAGEGQGRDRGTLSLGKAGHCGVAHRAASTAPPAPRDAAQGARAAARSPHQGLDGPVAPLLI